MSKRGRPVTGYCMDCGMMLDSRYNDFDVDDVVSGFYYGPEGEPLCRYHKDDYNDEEEGLDDEAPFSDDRVDFSTLFGPPLKCDICHQEKPDIRYADLLGKWICSDCMHVRAFSKEEESKEVS